MGDAGTKHNRGAALGDEWEGSSHVPPRLDAWLGILVVAAAYLAFAQLTRLWTPDEESVRPFYPAAGVATAGAFFIRRHCRIWATATAIALGASIHQLLLPGVGGQEAVADVIASTVEATVAVSLIQRLLLRRLPVRLEGFLVVVLITVVACGVGASVAAIGVPLPIDRPSLWFNWWCGHALGMVAVQTLPYLHRLTWVGDLPRWRRNAELAVSGVVLLGGAWLLTLQDDFGACLVIPAVGWIAMRFGPRAAVPLTLALVMMSSIQTAEGWGGFANHGSGMRTLQSYNLAILATGHLLGVYAERTDTERRRLRGLLIALPDNVTLEDGAGRFLYAFTPPGHRGRKLRDLTELLAPEDQARADAARQRVLTEGSSTDIWIFNNFGEERHFESRSARVGERQILTVTREITDAVLNERDLRMGEGMWRTLAETASEGILVIDADTNAIFANARVAEILGWPLDGIVGRSIAELAGDSDYRRIAPYRRLLRQGKPASFEIEIDAGLPEHRWVLTSANPILSHGVYTGAIALFSDTTALHAAEDERRAIEERLRSVESSERRRLAQELHDGPIQELVAADLRLGALRRSISAAAHEPSLRGIEAIIEDAVAQLRAMMSDLLPPEYQPGSVIDSLEEHVDRVVPTSVTVVVNDELLVAPAGPTANVLYLIGREAITNAVRHANAERIEIMLTGDDAGFRLKVTDDGTGMDVERAPSKRGHLGLRSMYDRAEVVGGRVIISSADGHGTTVDAWIPTTEPGSAILYELPVAPV